MAAVLTPSAHFGAGRGQAAGMPCRFAEPFENMINSGGTQ